MEMCTPFYMEIWLIRIIPTKCCQYFLIKKRFVHPVLYNNILFLLSPAKYKVGNHHYLISSLFNGCFLNSGFSKTIQIQILVPLDTWARKEESCLDLQDSCIAHNTAQILAFRICQVPPIYPLQCPKQTWNMRTT